VTDFLQDHPDGMIVAMDQLSLYFQATTTHVWSPIGQTPQVRVTPQRRLVHFYGALNLRTGQEIALVLPQQTTESTVHFLRHGLACLPHRPILLLLDRAPWHHGPALRALLDQEPRLELMYFPPACPDLNPQEHVWKLARDAVGHNHDFTDFGRLCRAFRYFLNHTLFDIDFLTTYVPEILYEV
jgi:transposase